jgi:TonB family protein
MKYYLILLSAIVIACSTINEAPKSRTGLWNIVKNKTKRKFDVVHKTISDSNYVFIEKYDKDSIKYEQGFYHKRNKKIKHGTISYFYPNGKIKYKKNYKHGRLNGNLVGYYSNGKLRRSEIYGEKGRIAGKLYNQKGEEIEYVPIFQNPKYKGGKHALKKYLNEKVEKYKATKGERGEILFVEFTVDTNAHIKNVMARNNYSEVHTKIAKHFIKKTEGKWTPGIREGKLVPYRMKISVDFSRRAYSGINSSDFIMPEFEGGMNELRRFISDNVEYPQEAIQNNKKGRVIVGFIIEEDGSLTNFKIVRGVSPLLNKSSIKVIQKTQGMWKPAKLDGKPIFFLATVPVTFRLRN